MNEDMIKSIWQSYNQDLQKSLTLNQEILIELKKTKVDQLLNSIRPYRFFAIVVGVLWILFVDSIIILSFLAGNYFLLGAAIIHSIVTKVALGISIYHLIVIKRMTATDSVIEVQSNLARFKLSTLTGIRLSLAQLPIFTIFYLNDSMIQSMNGIGWLIQITLTLAFTWAGYWCFRNIRLDPSDKKWVQFLFHDDEWASLQKAGSILDQIEGCRN